MNLGGEYSFISQNMRIHVSPEILQRFSGKQDFDDVDNAILYSRFSHEFTHFWQNFFTTYGMFKTLNSRVAGLTMMAAIEHLQEDEVDMFFPLDEMIDRHKVDQEKWEIFIAWSKITLQTEDFFERNGLVEDHHKFRSVFRPRVSTSPVYSSPGSGSFSLNAATLLEFQALFQQIETLDRTPSISKQIADPLVSEIHQRYPIRNVWKLICTAFSDPKICRGKHVLAYEMISLALTPEFPSNPVEDFRWMGITYREPEFDRFYWEEIHPGWRFRSMLKVIKDKHLKVPKSDVEVAETMQIICEALDYMHPFYAIQKLVSNLKETSLSFPELLELSDHLEPVWAASFSTVRVCQEVMADQKFRSYLHGPVNSKPRINHEAIIMDYSLQMLNSDHFSCPVCFQEKHKNDCEFTKFAADTFVKLSEGNIPWK